MEKVSATQFARRFGRYREKVQREPIAVTSHDRVTGYFVSERDFAEYRQLRARFARSVRVVDLDEETIDLIANSRMDSKYDYLNALLDEDDQ